MGNFYERASRGSANHKAIAKQDSIQISVINSSPEALERFQPVAQEAIDNEGDGYEILGLPQVTSRHLGNLIVSIVLIKKDHD